MPFPASLTLPWRGEVRVVVDSGFPETFLWLTGALLKGAARLGWRAKVRKARKEYHEDRVALARGRLVSLAARRLRSRVPRCGACGTPVMRYLVRDELDSVQVVAECHGATQLARHEHGDLLALRSDVAWADWLGARPFA